MDFLITGSTPPAHLHDRYSKVYQDTSWWISYADSGNIGLFENDGKLAGIAAGSLFGPLADGQVLQLGTPYDLGVSALEANGSFAVGIPREDEVVVVTDAGGSIPVYYAYGPQGFAVGTLVHHVAAAAGCMTVDTVSVADYLFNQTVCYPYSWYENVRAVPPCSVCTFNREGKKVHAYWKPAEPDNLYDRNADVAYWGQRLRDEVQRAVHLGIEGKSTGRVMYSGGTDSRAILSLIPDSFDCTPTTVLDGGKGHREYELARRSATALGRTLEWVPRPDGYYRSMIPERIDRIGPGWDFRHTHIFGSVAEQFEDVDVVLGGYLADTLFKTPYMSNVRKRHLRPDLLLDPMPDTVAKPNFKDGSMGTAALWSDAVSAAQERRGKHHKRLKEIRPLTAGNWHTVWPFTGQRFTYAHYLTCLRMNAQIVEPFLWHQTYMLAAEMPDYCRVERRAFRAAFAKGMGRAGMIMTSSGRVPRWSDGSLRGRIIDTAARYTRGWPTIKRKLMGDKTGQGPWPPDHEGWHPVNPDNHLGAGAVKRAQKRLESILAEGKAGSFWRDSQIPKSMRVRVLALGLDMSS